MPNVVANESHYPVLIRWVVHSGWLQDFMSVQLYREVANLDRHLMTIPPCYTGNNAGIVSLKGV